MRHFYLTVFASTVLLLAACNEASKSDYVDLASSEAVAADSKLDGENTGQTERSNHDEADGPKEEVSESIDDKDLPEEYQGLNPDDISRAEIDELIVLQKDLEQRQIKYQQELSGWFADNPSTRGNMISFDDFAPSKKDIERKRGLDAKFAVASSRKRYESYGPDVLSTEEISELIVLEQEQEQALSLGQDKYKNDLEIWESQDPEIRGEKPSMDVLFLNSMTPRFIELSAKAQSAEGMNRLKNRVKNLSSTHNILLIDSDISEWATLEQEASKLQVEIFEAMHAARNEKQFDEGKNVNSSDFIERIFADAFPKHKAIRMFEIEERMDAIEAPLKAAEIADRTRKNMSRRSEKAGVSISSREIRETIDLKVELDRIKKRAKFEAQKSWLEGDGSLPNGSPQLNAEDVARIKEINARIKEISAPMDEALMDLK